MLAKVTSASLHGIDGYRVTVEVDIAAGLPNLATVGMPDTAVREARDRVIAAIRNSGYPFPTKRITVNLAPAHIKKEGSSFDLPMAVGILAAAGILTADKLEEWCLIGELALDGTLRPVMGVLPIVLELLSQNVRGVILPQQNVPEASIVKGIKVVGAGSLKDVIVFLQNPQLAAQPHDFFLTKSPANAEKSEIDFADVKGQRSAKRALEIAAAGAHNVLMVGPPGSGKTLLSKCMRSILPPLTWEQSLETSKIHSVTGLTTKNRALVTTQPFRNPHHTISDIALIGGGQSPKPGEVSLAHNGVLFLDELPEFHRDVLEVLRQPLESREVIIARAKETLRFPANFLLIAAMNPCPCGFSGHPVRECVCTPIQIQKYRSKVSGPLLDRMDIHLEVPALTMDELEGLGTEGETSETIRARVLQSRNVQKERFHVEDRISTNSQMNSKQIKKYCPLNIEGRVLLRKAAERLGLSGRAYDKILKLSRTIGDLDGSEKIFPAHIAEAIQYRSLDRFTRSLSYV
ncbi:MAG: YifB family Mg chelatase-like AAA ATPase [Elusimicrobia bacterium]|nr:YifB family Mg chelatase-like AAA ATPase [Elusimicrobiota bacterium]